MQSIFHKLYRAVCVLLLPWLAFFLIDVFLYLCTNSSGWATLAYSALWACIFTIWLSLFPKTAARILFLLLYGCSIVYSILQAGYFFLFGKLMWLKDILYLRDGAAFAGSVFSFLPVWFLPVSVLLLGFGVFVCSLRPATHCTRPKGMAAALCTIFLLALQPYLLEISCAPDAHNLGMGTDYYAGKSLHRAYELMYDAKKVYSLCGLYQTVGRDIAIHFLAPQLPGNKAEENQKLAAIEAYFDTYSPERTRNDMSGIFAGKNVILVLMESADDWAIREDDAPTITKMMREGINFTNMYTPLYGSVRTFNSEFTINTGIFSPTDGNLTFTYCGNDYAESLPKLFRKAGYSANAFHYNSPHFYSRGIMSPAMGYENYICYADYAEHNNSFSRQLNEDSFVLTNPALKAKLLCDTPFFHFVISRNAHMPYSNMDSVSRYALEKYPQYAGIDSCEEVNYYYAKIHLLDDFFSELLVQLEQEHLLNHTVIVAVTDHFSYSMQNQQRMKELSNVPIDLMVEKTPFFIWSADIAAPITVNKTINTADVLPTLLNLWGIESPYRYIGHDAFDPNYSGYAVFSDGSWITNDVVYQDGNIIHEFYDGAAEHMDIPAMNALSDSFIETVNLILQSDYYSK